MLKHTNDFQTFTYKDPGLVYSLSKWSLEMSVTDAGQEGFSRFFSKLIPDKFVVDLL